MIHITVDCETPDSIFVGNVSVPGKRGGPGPTKGNFFQSPLLPDGGKEFCLCLNKVYLSCFPKVDGSGFIEPLFA